MEFGGEGSQEAEDRGRTHGRRIVFTLFRPDDPVRGGTRGDILKRWLEENTKFAIIGRELAPSTGAVHYQGYASLSKLWRIKSLRENLWEVLELPARGGPSFRIEVARGNEKRNIEYCSKDGEVWQCGRPGGRQGERSDLKDAMELIRSKRSYSEVIDEPELQKLLIRNANWVSMQFWRGKELQAREHVQELSLYRWQRQLLSEIEGDPDERKITFVVGPGNTGKSTFARFLHSKRDDVELWSGPICKAHDLICAVKGSRVQLFDITRSDGEPDYSLLESIKNGLLFSGKYLPLNKQFPQPHVVVFMNQVPDRNALSEDRYNIMDLDLNPELMEREE